MKINSHNEWDKLKEVIVGTATGSSATIEWNRPEKIDEKSELLWGLIFVIPLFGGKYTNHLKFKTF